jgi:3-methyladenine DNA glycosylase AlkC
MAEPLKNQYGADVPRAIAAMIAAVHPHFDSVQFVREALDGYEALELMPRGKKIAHALRAHLPADYEQAVAILLASLDQPHGRNPDLSLASFLYLPHTVFVVEYGLAHFEVSMRAQHALTQRFTAEFSIRPFLVHHPEATLRQLAVWATDPSAHVRRLVSEGTRPRLPWAPRLRQFQTDPAPVLALLELLKDDPELYVRRSVANSLNDIGKDHPEVLNRTAQAWLKNATP